MVSRPVDAPDRDPARWRLAAPHDGNTQGIIVSGFTAAAASRALFLTFDWRPDAKGGGSWLGDLMAVAPITDADGEDSSSAAIAFTWLGLWAMGLDDKALDSFDRPFKEGMFQEDRLRRLGDRRGEAWCPTVIAEGPKWSGNTLSAPQIATPTTVHALLLLYDQDDARLAAWCADVKAALAPHKVSIARELDLRLDRGHANGLSREHFGFADGISQPLPYEPGVVKLRNGEDAPSDDSIHRVPLGEILMGHANSHSEIARGPVVPDSPAGRTAGLNPDAHASGFLDLGIDGSYMVVRELKQDVAKFWESMDKAAVGLNAATDRNGSQFDADWVANRVVGRDRDGHLLSPGGPLPVASIKPPDNEFLFFDRDRHGDGCPLGSHIRRGNPRDGLAPEAKDKATLLRAANSHRVLRRGRKFGPDIADRRKDDGVDRGLLFICFNTDIARQFEFIQQTWVLNQNFASLYDEVDPLIGPSGTFTIPDSPLRRIVPIETFVHFCGGEYFFLPSLSALKYLVTL